MLKKYNFSPINKIFHILFALQASTKSFIFLESLREGRSFKDKVPLYNELPGVWYLSTPVQWITWGMVFKYQAWSLALAVANTPSLFLCSTWSMQIDKIAIYDIIYIIDIVDIIFDINDIIDIIDTIAKIYIIDIIAKIDIIEIMDIS